jgi:hypothetical protein
MTNNKTITGTWHIQKMEMWDADYFNMEVQAFLEINQNLKGEFQFGLVTGEISGKIKGERFEFLWEGNDENDEANGGGWLQMKDDDTIEGEFIFYEGESSTFVAKRFL